MDAFAVAVCKGLGMKKLNRTHALTIALFFGGFQALMPFVGWLLGSQFERYIIQFDHWIAFVLLGFIGGKMIADALKEGDECKECAKDSDSPDLRELLMLAVATSIDALAVGVTFALLPNTDIGLCVGTIGIVTFALSLLGVWVGNRFGSRYKSRAELAGGVILVLIGLKILLEHLGLIAF